MNANLAKSAWEILVRTAVSDRRDDERCWAVVAETEDEARSRLLSNPTSLKPQDIVCARAMSAAEIAEFGLPIGESRLISSAKEVQRR